MKKKLTTCKNCDTITEDQFCSSRCEEEHYWKERFVKDIEIEDIC